MKGVYDQNLVELSFAVAVLAAYTALDLAGCVSASTSSPRKSWIWLTAGAVSMGTGIWSMHFIGMLAFHLPVPVAYDLPISLLSMMIAIIVSAIALMILRRPVLSAANLGGGAVLMGAGISAMHYTGMYAMRMSPPIHYDALLFVASVLIAMGASLAALWIAFQLRAQRSRLAMLGKIGSAIVMGLAITGMHYTGMAAAHFAPGSICLGARASGFSNLGLALGVGGTTFGILSLTLIVSALDAHFALNNARLAASLKKITAELHAAQGELLTTAREAGMAEIANDVLHNVGNVLNSVNVSAGMLAGLLRESKAPGGIAKVAELLHENGAHLGEFMTRDQRGMILPAYLHKLSTALAAERQAMIAELETLARSIDHIKEIVATQQAYAGATRLIEPVSVADLLEDALRINGDSIARRGFTIVKDFAELPPVLLDKHRVLQILINLIGNARQAMDALPGQPHRLTLKADVAESTEGDKLRIRVQDDGEGIDPANLPRLFTHGFTTRVNGHGFGLHSCALAVKAMMGTLGAFSEGRGQGAVFTLELPLKRVVEREREAVPA